MVLNIRNQIVQFITIFVLNISGIVVWLEKLPYFFIALLAYDVLYI